MSDKLLNCDPKYLNSILKLTGRPHRRIIMDQIRWTPFKQIG
jgi:hypothetical protein